ncbi:MAG: hypothetical protein RLZZ597_3767 [Cyanobacteriota bacterium]|jgi:hypothetical protein
MARLLKSAMLRYALTISLVTALVLVARLAITWAAEVFLHPLPIAGGLIKSLELVELSVVPLFALLGFGLGAASRSLPAKTSRVIKALPLIVILPLVFFSSYWLRYHLWLDQIMTQANLPRDEVIAMANTALERESGSAGFWGYYRTTTRMPILPATGAELQRMTEDQNWFRSELTRFSGIEPGVFSMIFDGAGWGIRIFYMILAGVTGLIYVLKGMAWADTQRLRAITQPKKLNS